MKSSEAVTEQTAEYETADIRWIKSSLAFPARMFAKIAVSFEQAYIPQEDGFSLLLLRSASISPRRCADFSDSRSIAAGLAAWLDIEASSNSGSFSS